MSDVTGIGLSQRGQMTPGKSPLAGNASKGKLMLVSWLLVHVILGHMIDTQICMVIYY